MSTCPRSRRGLGCILLSLIQASVTCVAGEEYTSPRSKAACLAYQASPFSELSLDYFARFSRDPQAAPSEKEMAIGKTWCILLSADAKTLTKLMAGHLRDFLNQRMGLNVSIEKRAPEALSKATNETVVLLENGIRDTSTLEESFSITTEPRSILINGKGSIGLRNGIVKLVSIIGLRQSPILELGKQVYEPRVRLRVGEVPWMGSYRDLVFMGYNGVVLSGAESKGSFRPIPDPIFSIYALSTSEAIPELRTLRNPEAFARLNRYAEGARKYDLKSYIWLNLRPIFTEDHPAFKAHPDIRGALMYDDHTWYQKPGNFILCTESPLVRQYVCETVKGIFQALPGLSGIGVIIGGEEFHHCFMRPYAVEKGHTTCPRCEALGHDAVVANLCNYMADAARQVNPTAEVFAWPYSASYVWSIGDPAQLGFIRKLKPGVALFTDIVKDDTVSKPEGVNKLLWDYSIDLPGPGKLAQQQLNACHERGIPIDFKSEPELAFEASRLPGMPCLDRWVKRAEAMTSSNSDGAWVFPWFVPCFGASTAEVFTYFWWQPAPDPEEFLQRFASRIAGPKAGPHLRRAWHYASQAVDYSPEIGPYFTGVYYLGPAHPMCAEPTALLPDEFQMSGGTSFVLPPTGDVRVFAKLYRKMADSLAMSVKEINLADQVAPKTSHIAYDAEVSNLRWFYHTFRSAANYYESCLLRDKLLAFAKGRERSPSEVAEATRLYGQWRRVLLDEKRNATDAMPVMAGDMRLDYYHGFAGSVAPGKAHGIDMIRKKLEILETELNQFLPLVARRDGIVPEPLDVENP
jgi:hypothetical protein